MEIDHRLYQAVIAGGGNKHLDGLDDSGPISFLQGATSGRRNSILHVAARCGSLQTAEKIVSSCPSLLHQTNSNGDSPLHVAAGLGRLEMSRFLINCAKLVEVEDDRELVRIENSDGDTAVHVSVRGGHFEVVALLLSEDPELSRVVNCNGESPLFLAVDRKRYSVASHILKAAPMCSFGGRAGMNVLHAAIIRAEKDMVVDMFASCLKFAAFFGIRFSLAASELGFLKFGRSRTFRYIGKDFICEVLRRCPSAISEADAFGWIPLHYAACSGNAEVVELFLEHNGSLAYLKDGEGMSALHIAAKFGQDGVIAKLVDRCPGVAELSDDKGQNALHVAAEYGNSGAVRILLSNWVLADLITEKNGDGNTAFHLAALHGHHETLLVLATDYRVDQGATNNQGYTALDILQSSARLEQHEKARILCKLRTRGALRRIDQAFHYNTPERGHQQQPSPEAAKEHQETLATRIEHAKPAARKDCGHQHRKQTTRNAINLAVAAIIAAAAFQAAFTLPGGYKPSGTATLSRKPGGFALFVVSDASAFGLAAASMLLHFGASGVRNECMAAHLIKHATLFTQLSICAMAVSFLAGIYVVLRDCLGLAAIAVAVGCCSLLGPVVYSCVAFLCMYACS